MNPSFTNPLWYPNENPFPFVPFQNYYRQRALVALSQAQQTPNPVYNSPYVQTHNSNNFMTIQPCQQWGHNYGYYPTFYQPSASVQNESLTPSSESCRNAQQPPMSYGCYPSQAYQPQHLQSSSQPTSSIQSESLKPPSEPCHNQQPPKSYIFYPYQEYQPQQLQFSSQVGMCEVEANLSHEYSLISDPDIETLLGCDVTMADISDTSLVAREDKRRANTEDLSTVNGNLLPWPYMEKQDDEVSDEELLAMCKKNMDELLNIEKKFSVLKEKLESLVTEEDRDSL